MLMECFLEVDRLLPTDRPSHSCNPEGVTESIGRPVIFVCINGRYDLHLPKRVCNTCHYEWTPDWEDLIISWYMWYQPVVSCSRDSKKSQQA
ncbi:hypothetical protein KUCAC02_019479 [Chaenocephalus aceratus]|uniref:Uncharacterized protein n=1 Tax=Chaenocephalus aceratus TaxID=36190 RepID=A0ACB9VPJ4_CHAAC|nr:hypothetical protein KUCAC02_019479 [Chaenocephalus aceratus]